eukprot:GFKZ01006036.1.p2 GENE.GFKZ01006036.1~~GFKZ01006036.1.p2  ORF type:complete len:121 (-),score=23.36 GFKZ01006036.1:42-404(-)
MPDKVDVFGGAVFAEIARGAGRFGDEGKDGAQFEATHETHVFERRLRAAVDAVLDETVAEGGYERGERVRHGGGERAAGRMGKNWEWGKGERVDQVVITSVGGCLAGGFVQSGGMSVFGL